MQTHHCMPQRRRVNVKKREVLAARMHEKMQSTPEPYFVFVDSDNQLMPYTGDSEGNVKQILLERSFPATADTEKTDEADSDDLVNRIKNKDSSENDLLQNIPFQLTESSAVLSCLPQCERELFHSATMETLSAELEMVVCNNLKLHNDGIAVDKSATDVSDASNNLLVDVEDEQIPAENGIMSEDVDEQGCSSSLRVEALSLKHDDIASDPSKGQQWSMATSLGNGRLQCNVCHKELRIANYYPHMRRVHKMPSSRSRPIVWKVCDRCGYQCQDNYKLRRHALKHARYGKFLGKPFKLDSTCSSQLYKIFQFEHLVY